METKGNASPLCEAKGRFYRGGEDEDITMRSQVSPEGC